MNKFKTLIDLDQIRDFVNMSTITLTCKINTEFHVLNIFKYMPLVKDRIVTIKYGADMIRTLVPVKKKSRKDTRQKKIFLNQVTIVVNTQQNRLLNIKLFKNGSLQITGCKNYEHFINDLTIMFVDIIKPFEANNVQFPFVRNPELMNMNSINEFAIRMINCSFNAGFQIDRCLLYYSLKELSKELSNKQTNNDVIICVVYDSCTHASVNIKYNKNGNVSSLFVFESGCIIITGVIDVDQLIDAYNFIVDYLNNNYGKIMKINIADLL